MILRMMETGPLMVNCYILGDEETKETAVVDPGGDAGKIIKVLDEIGLKLKFILNTHTHWDHVGGNAELAELTGAPVVTHRDEAPALEHANERAGMFGYSATVSSSSDFVEEGDTLMIGDTRLEVIDLRGHSPAGLGFVLEAEIDLEGGRERKKMVICGDALFAGSIGRTDFPGGDMPLLLKNIRDKIFSLPDDTLVLPGHGPVSTVGQEKRHNPFFRN